MPRRVVTLNTGEHITATMAVEWSDVDLAGGWLHVRGETRKGGLDDRSYQIPAETVALLERLPRDGNGPFDCPHCIGTIYRRLKELLERAGLPTDRRSMFHRVRRTTASHYAAAGGNAQELLGHSSAKVTRGYLDPKIVQQPQAPDLLWRLGE